MIASITAWAGAAAALLSIIAIIAKWWWSRRPSVRAKARRKKNEEISKRVRAGDADWVNDFLREAQDEDD